MHARVVIFYEGCVQTASFSDLLLDEIVTEATDLEIILDLSIHIHDCLSYFYFRLASLIIYVRVQIELIENKDLFLYWALVNSKKQVSSHFAVVSDLVKRLSIVIRVVALAIAWRNFFLIEDDEYFAKDQWVRKWSKVVKKHLIEVIEVALLWKTHLRVCEVLS